MVQCTWQVWSSKRHQQQHPVIPPCPELSYWSMGCWGFNYLHWEGRLFPWTLFWSISGMIHWSGAWMKCTPLSFTLIERLYICCAGATKPCEYLMAILNITCSVALPTRYSSDQSSLKLSRTERPLLPWEIRLTLRGEERKTKEMLLPPSWVMQQVSNLQSLE